jgi:hypothetical protein
VTEHAILIVDAPPFGDVIEPGGAGWIERSCAPASMLGLTPWYVTNPTISGSSTSSERRIHFLSASTRPAWIGCLNNFQRSSLSLTKIRMPTSAVIMYCASTVAGIGALLIPTSGGSHLTPNLNSRYARMSSTSAWRNGCFIRSRTSAMVGSLT